MTKILWIIKSRLSASGTKLSKKATPGSDPGPTPVKIPGYKSLRNQSHCKHSGEGSGRNALVFGFTCIKKKRENLFHKNGLLSDACTNDSFGLIILISYFMCNIGSAFANVQFS